ncbi:hypothetical protein TNCV_4044431 [Trichonephila clavipes]|nr:hypothetical protein TNCV_4044431 [Trichonephila clavipes]
MACPKYSAACHHWHACHWFAIPALYDTSRAVNRNLCALHPATNQRAASKLTTKPSFQTTFSPRRRTKAMTPGSHQSTNHRHATQQDEKKKNSTLVMPNNADYPDMGLRTILQPGCPKSNTYSMAQNAVFSYSTSSRSFCRVYRPLRTTTCGPCTIVHRLIF